MTKTAFLLPYQDHVNLQFDGQINDSTLHHKLKATKDKGKQILQPKQHQHRIKSSWNY